MRSGRPQAPAQNRQVSAADSTAPAEVIKLRTRKAAWLRLVRATRDPAAWALIHQHRAAWAAYVAGRCA